MKIVMNTLFTKEQLPEVSLSARVARKKAPEVKDTTITTLIPVQLTDEEMEKFVKAFHPKKAAKGPQAFVEEATYLIDISAYLTAIFTGLRYGLSRHQYDSVKPDMLGDMISKEIEVTYNASSELDKKAKEYMLAMATGQHHIIRDSERYAGGKDILYIGLRGPNASPLLSSDGNYQLLLPIMTSSYAYEDRKATFDSDLGKAFVQTGLEIQALFLGKESISKLSSSYARIYKQHTIGMSATVIRDITQIFMSGPLAKMGVPVMLPAFKGAQTEHAVNRLKDYCSILALREPNGTIVTQRIRTPKETPDESINICKEALALQPDIRFSFAVNLPKNFCEYITQTKEEQLPLVPLNTWAIVWSAAMLRPPKARSAGNVKDQRSQGTRLLIPERAPKYILRPSMSDTLIDRRKKLGMYSEKGRVSEDGIYITYNGDLAFLNTAEDSAVENAKAYESLSEEALAICFEAGTPLAAGQKGSTGAIFELASPKYAEKIAALKDKLHQFKGSVQAINWDLNTVITVSVANPDNVVATKLVGGSAPADLNLAVYLREPFHKGMRDMFSRTKDIVEGKRFPVTSGTFKDVASAISTSSVFNNFAIAYNHFLERKLVPTFETLVKSAAEALKITTLEDEEVVDYELQFLDRNRSIYNPIIDKDMSINLGTVKAGHAAVSLLMVVARQASAGSGTNLARICIRDNIDFKEHDRFFDGKESTSGEFSRLYMWLGGQVFFQAVQAMLAIPHKDLIDAGEASQQAEALGDANPGFLNIMNEVMPLCVLLGKYVTPEIRDKIYKSADNSAEAADKFTENDINLAGSKPKGADGKGGMKLFPHQAETLIRLKPHPKIAVLDIAPGGGKTTIGISDIAMLYADGLIKKPFIFCPNRLVKNWIEDLHKSYSGWNIIPVTTETYAEWGEERLTDLIKNAPPNTIVVVGNSFISSTEKTQLVIGNAVDTLSNSVEFCKKFEPDYVILDESQRVRNVRSELHKGIKTICQMSSVKYGRIATGTLIQNVLSDVVGQSALFNGQIFRTVEEFEDEHKGVVAIVNDKQIVDYLEDTPLKARRRLAEFATVISFKRKEWAFMLPMPVETFITVNMEDSGDAGHKLQQFYDAVLKKTLEEAKNDPRLKKGRKGDDNEDDEETDAEKSSDRKIVTADGVSLEVSDDDDDSDSSDELEAALQPYLQRLERLLTDPFGDEDLLPVAKEIFGEDFDTGYVTPKVQKVIDRIQNHFKEVPWEKGKEYKASDMTDFNGKSYIFKSELAIGEGAEKSIATPDSDTTNWKPQIRGKVFIVCRYTRSVDAIYNALPKSLKEGAVRFHGEVDNKDESLNRFQKDPKCTILIANEEGVSEGHNFQMASRFIRVEAPWAPGELDQTSSRIFRPDVGGEYTRQTIFLDWILCDNTLEVAKMGRLISKMLKRTKFDELDNPKYYKELNPLNLPIIKMGLDNIIALHKVDDLCAIAGEGDKRNIHGYSYLGQYQYLISQMGQEFREMRQTKRAYMLDVEPTPMPKGSAKIEFTPWVPNMHVEDLNNDGLIPLRAALEDKNSDLAQQFRKDSKALIGQYVRTEFGIGIIDRVTTKRGTSSDDEGAASAGNEISKVRVKFSQGGTANMLSASKVFLATNITERNKDKYNAKAPKITAADKKRTEASRIKAEKALARIRSREEKLAQKLATVKAPKAKPEAAPVATKTVQLYPVVYNEFLAIEGIEDDAESKELRRHGFTRFGSYAYIVVQTYQNFTVLLSALEKAYTLSPKTVKYLDMLHESFQSGRGRKFAVELAPMSELPGFHRIRHTLTHVTNTKKPELKLYPVILNGSLMLVVDLATNPVFRKRLNKSVPGMTGKNNHFAEADGMDICFFKNKTAVVAKVKELRQAGFTITDLDEFKEELSKLSLKAATK